MKKLEDAYLKTTCYGPKKIPNSVPERLTPDTCWICPATLIVLSKAAFDVAIEISVPVLWR
jgi:hypothetical protein